MSNIKVLVKKVVNRLLIRTEIKTIPTDKKIVYLTFDDGPEEGITEFVLGELAKYNYTATFFCRGDNATKYPLLLERIRNEGHAVANHTFSHIHSFDMNSRKYVEDVHKCDAILNTKLFRPPHGSLKLSAWLRLKKDYKIFFWSLNSGDSDMDSFNYEHSINTLQTKTKKGDIVLFHFCHKHEAETRQLLPVYLKWLDDNNFISKALN